MTASTHVAQATAAVLALSRATQQVGPDWEFAPQARAALGQLARLARVLPEVIEYTLVPVEHAHGHGRLTVDGGGNPARAAQHLGAAVRTAVQAAELLADALAHAHAAAFPLGVDTSKSPTSA
ncbi:hypothetical protein ME763_32070 [Streptomyces murinus]|uniref:hypothetical protein n=1 Tax=Streptomyces murinus TaxID=33900 RepID=UPI000A1F414C|nr:hypothetical protein [Streptomyces murinus]WDO09927.1 hypothetical protein ME763_32070 [Streptomyces murinus]